MDVLSDHLASHSFEPLFVEVLGWDRASGNVSVDADGFDYDLKVIAHKRGFQVLHCAADKYTLFNRRRLRSLQKQILRIAHEHIVVYSCDQPAKQVWQWAVRLPDGRRLRHREHPFFSSSPPAGLLARLRGMRFTLGEEEALTLMDAITRVRTALDTDPEHNLFAGKPWYAEQSDRLATAMQSGDVDAFQDFISLHIPMAAWGAKRWRHYFGDLDEEDRNQIAVIGLIQAAKRFDSSRGYQFSTYAYQWIRQACQRYGHDCAYFVRIPPHVFQHCRPIMARLRRFRMRGDDTAEAEYLEHLNARKPKIAGYWRRFCRVHPVVSLSDPSSEPYAAARRIPSDDGDPLESLNKRDVEVVLYDAVNSLPPDDASIIRMRFGLDGSDPRTLKEIGDQLDLTRERIRQRILGILDRLLPVLAVRLDLAIPATAPESSDDEKPESSRGNPSRNGSAMSMAERAILDEIARHPSGLSAIALSERLNLTRSDRKATLRALVEQGRIVKNGDGRNTVYRPRKPLSSPLEQSAHAH